ncbi:MAG: hypothetical protein ACR2JE_08620 [Acidobacteriaceae bacterium]
MNPNKEASRSLAEIAQRPSANSWNSSPDDTLTLIALGLLAYVISNVLHEGLGHGGVAWLSGATKMVLTSTYLDADRSNRWIEAGGTLVNLLAGLLCWGALRGMRTRGFAPRFFVWLLAAFNLLLGTGYFLFSGIGGIGDWAAVIAGFRHIWAWRAGLTLLGIVTYGASMWLLALELARLIPAQPAGMKSRLRHLTLTPYLAAGLTACAAGARNPMGWKLVLISAAASSFGGAYGLLRIPGITLRAQRHIRSGKASGGTAATLRRNCFIIGIAALVLLADVLVLGRGITIHVH